jgi:hypothetical protein
MITLEEKMNTLREALQLAAAILAAGFIIAGLIAISSMTTARAGDIASVRYVCHGVFCECQ